MPCLLFVETKTLCPIVVTLSTITVKKSGLGLKNPVTSAHKKIDISQRTSIYLVNEVTGESKFSTTDHVIAVRDERSEGGEERNRDNKIKLAETVQECPKLESRIMLHMNNVGSWLTAHGTTVTGTVLAGMEFRDFLYAHYNLTPH